jgi:hypothetical protein
MTTRTRPDPAQIQSLLRAAFPDADVSPELANAMSDAVQEGDIFDSEQIANMPNPAGLSFAAPGDGPVQGYYLGEAVHSRSIPIPSTFEGHLPLARVTLPMTGGNEPIETAIGWLIPNDRKILNVGVLPTLIGRKAARVDMVTPPRSPSQTGGRFGAVALYLGYDTEDAPGPSFYILEAGTATGQPKVLFYGEKVNEWIINKQTSYQPTPFCSPANFYSGILKMSPTDPDEISSLTIQSRTAVDSNPYIQIDVTYKPQRVPPMYKPLDLILEAAARVGIIGDAIGIDPGTETKIAAALFGGKLDWIQDPTQKQGAAS